MAAEIKKDPVDIAYALFEDMQKNDLHGRYIASETLEAIKSQLELGKKDASALDRSGRNLGKAEMEKMMVQTAADADIALIRPLVESLEDESLGHDGAGYKKVASNVVRHIDALIADSSALTKTPVQDVYEAAGINPAQLEEAAKKANIRAARQGLKALEDVTGSSHHGAIPLKTEIYAALNDSKLDEAVLGANGETAEQMKSRIITLEARGQQHQSLALAKKGAQQFLNVELKRVNPQHYLDGFTNPLVNSGLAAIAEKLEIPDSEIRKLLKANSATPAAQPFAFTSPFAFGESPYHSGLRGRDDYLEQATTAYRELTAALQKKDAPAIKEKVDEFRKLPGQLGLAMFAEADKETHLKLLLDVSLKAGNVNAAREEFRRNDAAITCRSGGGSWVDRSKDDVTQSHDLTGF